VTDACLEGDEFGGGTPCENPDVHLFWDGRHATAAGHSILAEAALEVLAPVVPR
jgi:lysophospholipase L1-like esterase